MFQQNNEFCTICGSILPLPDKIPGLIQCALCKTKWPVQFENKRVVCRYERNFEKDAIGDLEIEEDITVDHICPKCDHNLATYTTQQTRSADEGQTVFYQCVKCKHRCIEYS